MKRSSRNVGVRHGTNDYKATADLEKGKRYPIRIEWLPDGDVSYIGLKVLSPLPEEERERLAFWSEMGMISITTSSTESLPWIR